MTRHPLRNPLIANLELVADFASDPLTIGWRFAILKVIDNYTRECPALVAKTSLSGERVANEMVRFR